MLRKSNLFILIAGLLVAAAIIGAGCTTAPGGNATANSTTPSVTVPPTATMTVNLSGLKVRDELAARTASYAASLNGDTLTLANTRGSASPEFRTIQTQLRSIRAEDSRIAYVYTVQQGNGTARFMVDAAYGEPNGSSPGDLYTSAPREFVSPISAPGCTGVYTDDWGTYISGYAPVRNSTGVIAGILVMDLPFSVMKSLIAEKATSHAAQVNVSSLSLAVAKGANSAEYRALTRQLAEMSTADARIDYIDIFQQENGTVRFVADSESGGSEESSRLGDTGIELPSQIPSAVNASGATDVYTDQWGTGFTGYAPIRNGTGAVIAVLRIDMGI